MRVLTQRDKKRLKNYFEKSNYILLVLLFGSHGTIYQREDSDIDFAILFNKKVDMLKEMSILDDLSSILRYENVDLVNLNEAPISLQFQALKGEIIYENNYYTTCDYMEKVFKLYADYKPILRQFDHEILQRRIDINEL